MKRTRIVVGLLLVAMSQTAESASNDADKQKTEGGKGTTVEDVARGLKSAAQNVEKEIPKIGSAIGQTLKKITEKDSSNKSAQDAPKEKK